MTNEMKKIKSVIGALLEASDEQFEGTAQKLNKVLVDAVNANAEFFLNVKMNEFDEIEYFQAVDNEDGEHFYTCFTDIEELEKGGEVNGIISMAAADVLDMVMMNPDMRGMVINPWDNPLTMPREWVDDVIGRTVLMRDGDNSMDIGQIDLTWLRCDAIVRVVESTGMNMTAEFCCAELKKASKVKAKHIIETICQPFYEEDEIKAILRKCWWNSLEEAKRNNLHILAFSPIADAVLLGGTDFSKKETAELMSKTIADWVKVNLDYKVNITLSCNDDEAEEELKKAWAYQEKLFDMRVIPGAADNGFLEKAIAFAMERHSGQVRKGTDKAYILHPLEVMNILAAMDADTNLLAAGVLHDTLEDTETTLLEIVDEFGLDVAELVNFHTDDKNLPWYVKRLTAVRALVIASEREKMLVMADKIANLRNMWNDYQTVGDELWKRFNAPKEMIAWYYSMSIDALSEMRDNEETAYFYWEMDELFKNLFVTYLFDEGKNLLYQVLDDPTAPVRVLKRNSCRWGYLKDEISADVLRIPRKYAERIEDNWEDELLKVLEKDKQDGDYVLFESPNLRTGISICNGIMSFEGYVPAEKSDKDYDFHYSLDNADTEFILFCLRTEYGLKSKLQTLLKKFFGGVNGAKEFDKYCDEHGVDIRFNAF